MAYPYPWQMMINLVVMVCVFLKCTHANAGTKLLPNKNSHSSDVTGDVIDKRATWLVSRDIRDGHNSDESGSMSAEYSGHKVNRASWLPMKRTPPQYYNDVAGRAIWRPVKRYQYYAHNGLNNGMSSGTLPLPPQYQRNNRASWLPMKRFSTVDSLYANKRANWRPVKKSNDPTDELNTSDKRANWRPIKRDAPLSRPKRDTLTISAVDGQGDRFDGIIRYDDITGDVSEFHEILPESGGAEENESNTESRLGHFINGRSAHPTNSVPKSHAVDDSLAYQLRDMLDNGYSDDDDIDNGDFINKATDNQWRNTRMPTRMATRMATRVLRIPTRDIQEAHKLTFPGDSITDNLLRQLRMPTRSRDSRMPTREFSIRMPTRDSSDSINARMPTREMIERMPTRGTGIHMPSRPVRAMWLPSDSFLQSEKNSKRRHY